MEHIVNEIYNAHKKREKLFSKLVSDLSSRLEDAEERLSEILEKRNEASEIERKWREIRSQPGASRLKSDEQKAEEEYIRSIRTKYPRNLMLKTQTLVKNLRAKLEKAKSSYSLYDVSDIDNFDIDDNEDVDMEDAESLAQIRNGVYDINALPRLTWISWPSRIKLPNFVPSMMGVGPGEQRLAKVIGADVQGGNVSYDLVTPDGSKWEVKSLDSKTHLVRPAVEGREAFYESRMMLSKAAEEIKDFSNTIDEETLEKLDDPRSQKIVELSKKFTKKYYSRIVKRSELSSSTIDVMAKIMKLVSEFKAKYEDNENSLSLALNNKVKFPVRKRKFFNIATALSEENPEVLAMFDKLTVATSALSDEIFDNVDEFLQSVEESLDMNEIFTQIDGLIIVNKSKGFNIIPRDKLNDALEWVLVSTGEPRLKFLEF